MLAAELVKITPSERQLAYQSLGFYAFIHFSVNTFTDKEWGDGTEPESIFNPSGLDAEQWVSAVRDAGMKGLILTCKIPTGRRILHRCFCSRKGFGNLCRNGHRISKNRAFHACSDRQSPHKNHQIPHIPHACLHRCIPVIAGAARRTAAGPDTEKRNSS